MFESRKRHHLSRAPLALTPGRDKPEGASAWELRGYAVGGRSLGARLRNAGVRCSSHLRLTLHSVTGGNVRPQGLSDAAFDAD